MEIAFLVIAVLGLLALTGGGNVSGSLSSSGGIGSVPPPPQPYQDPSQPLSPTLPTPTGPPMVPSQSANVDGALISGGASVGTSVLAKTGLEAAKAIPIVGAVVAVAAAIASALLAAHKARLQGATNENMAVDQYVPVFDSFVKQTTQAYNSKQITAAQAAQICQQFDHYIYQTFRAFVGKPGTAWNDSTGMSGKCNKSCTVGCCVYFGDLGPVLNNMSYVLGFPTGKWGAGDPRISGRTITVPKVYPSKYSKLSRDLYTITLN